MNLSAGGGSTRSQNNLCNGKKKEKEKRKKRKEIQIELKSNQIK